VVLSPSSFRSFPCEFSYLGVKKIKHAVQLGGSRQVLLGTLAGKRVWGGGWFLIRCLVFRIRIVGPV